MGGVSLERQRSIALHLCTAIPDYRFKSSDQTPAASTPASPQSQGPPLQVLERIKGQIVRLAESSPNENCLYGRPPASRASRTSFLQSKLSSMACCR